LRAKASPTVFAIQQSCHSVFAQKRQTLKLPDSSLKTYSLHIKHANRGVTTTRLDRSRGWIAFSSKTFKQQH